MLSQGVVQYQQDSPNRAWSLIQGFFIFFQVYLILCRGESFQADIGADFMCFSLGRTPKHSADLPEEYEGG